MTTEDRQETPDAVKDVPWTICNELNKNLPAEQHVEPVNQFKTVKNPDPKERCYMGFLLEIDSANPQGVSCSCDESAMSS